MNISSPWLRSYLAGNTDEPLIISTTGSGGVVKNIEIPAKALITLARAAHKYLGAKEGDTWSLLLPTNHIAGINVLVRSLILKSEIKSVSDKAEFTSIVPTQLHKALTEDAQLLKHLQGCKAVLVGGARLSENLAKSAETAGIKIVTTYGATETCGGCVYDGVPLEGIKVRINNGSIEIKFDEMSQTDWIKTNDLGEIVDGKLKVLGRADDVIISGGENISIEKLEKFLESEFPSQIFLALGLPDEKWGQSLALMSDSDFEPNLSDVIANGLGKLYVPKHLKVVKNIPTIGIGKYDRIAAAKLF